MDIEERPEDLLFLGQTEYHLVIRTQSGSLIQSLSHTHLIPNSIHRDLSTYWQSSGQVKGEVFTRPGRKYGGYTGTFHAGGSGGGRGMGRERVEYENRWRVEMMHDGSVAGIEQGRGLRWVMKLDDIAISAYDVLLPATPGSKPILLPQPPAHLPTLFPDASNNIQLMSLPASTYVHQSKPPASDNALAKEGEEENRNTDSEGLHTQNYFAMSSTNYPLIGYAPRAPQGHLIGGHLVHEAVKERLPPLIDPPSESETGVAIRKSDELVPRGENYTDGEEEDEGRTGWSGMGVLGVVVALVVVGVMMAAAYRYPTISSGIVGKVDRGIGEAKIPDERTRLIEGEKVGDVEISGNGEIVINGAENGQVNGIGNGNGNGRSLSMDKELPSIPLDDIKSDEKSAIDVSSSAPSAKDSIPNGHPAQNGSAVKEKIVIIKKTNGRRRKRGKKGKGKKGDPTEDGDDDDNEGDATETEATEESGAKGEMPTEASPEEDKEENQPAVVKAEHEITQVDGLSVSDDVIGFGSHGTVVYRGVFQGRAVAVKRLLRDFVSVASQEVALLQASDDHQNVIRYFYQEKRDNFLYIALELCSASLADIIERPQDYQELTVGFDRKKALYQITAGLKHLHGLKIIHRDLKPQNVLVSVNKKGTQRMLLSDFGLAKRLDHGQSSYAQTANHAVGSVGWRAPECLRGEVQLDDLFEDSSHSSLGNGSKGSTDGADGTRSRHGRLTKAVDLFALGCIYYYVLTSGCHPYGDRYEREVNIVRDHKVGLEKLDSYGEDGYEAKCLIEKLLSAASSDRPDSNYCLIHPFFWSVARRLAFLCDASDRFEIMELQPPEPTLVLLESKAMSVIGQSWQKRLDSVFLENLGKHRKYDSRSLRDLLRAMRNKKHHYQDLPDNVKRRLGTLPAGFLNYFTSRFPTLFTHVHEVIQDSKLRHESMFVSYFDVDD